MRKLSEAVHQLDGNLLVRPDTQVLLYRTLQDSCERLAAAGTDPEDGHFRALAALREALGDDRGPLPQVTDLLGDPRRDRLARNLLKG